MKQIHELKTVKPFFELIHDGSKTWELRRDDRDYQKGDLLWLREYEPETNGGRYTGRWQLAEVTSITRNVPEQEALGDGFIIMDIERRSLMPIT